MAEVVNVQLVGSFAAAMCLKHCMPIEPLTISPEPKSVHPAGGVTVRGFSSSGATHAS